MVRIAAIMLVLAFLAVGGRGAAGQVLRAGAAACDITPPVGCNMWGYSARQGAAKSVHDPLMAKVGARHALPLRPRWRPRTAPSPSSPSTSDGASIRPCAI